MKFLAFFLSIFLLCGCSAPHAETIAHTPEAIPEIPDETVVSLLPDSSAPVDTIGDLIDYMTLEQRVGQLFLARCDAEIAVEDIQKYHLGGYVFFAQDFENETPESFRQRITAYNAAADVPMLFAVDEEGGTVTRISRYPAFRQSRFPSPRTVFSSGGLEDVLTLEEEKCRLLQSLGINVNLGPVCDITTDPGAFMYQRSLGQNADITASYVSSTVTLMNAFGIGSVLKHFPGYGNNADTHTEIAVDIRSLSDLVDHDLIPFAAGIDAGCGAILVSHTIVETLDPQLPASLSNAVHRYLRDTMHFEGVILTDDLMMEAAVSQYGAEEAAVMAVLAGNDLLCSTDYPQQYNAVLQAVLDGRISIDILNAAVRNVLEWKTELGLLG